MANPKKKGTKINYYRPTLRLDKDAPKNALAIEFLKNQNNLSTTLMYLADDAAKKYGTGDLISSLLFTGDKLADDSTLDNSDSLPNDSVDEHSIKPASSSATVAEKDASKSPKSAEVPVESAAPVPSEATSAVSTSETAESNRDKKTDWHNLM